MSAFLACLRLGVAVFLSLFGAFGLWVGLSILSDGLENRTLFDLALGSALAVLAALVLAFGAYLVVAP